MFKSQPHADEAVGYIKYCGHTHDPWGRRGVSPDRPKETEPAHASPSSLAIWSLHCLLNVFVRKYTKKHLKQARGIDCKSYTSTKQNEQLFLRVGTKANPTLGHCKHFLPSKGLKNRGAFNLSASSNRCIALSNLASWTVTRDALTKEVALHNWGTSRF